MPRCCRNLPGGAICRDAACRRNVVCVHGITKHRQHAGALDLPDRRHLQGQVLEVRRVMDVGRCLVPLIETTPGDLDGLPHFVAFEDGRVPLGEHAGQQAATHRLRDLGLRRPEVLEEHGAPIFAGAQGLLVQVNVNTSGQRIGHDQRRRCQVAAAHQRIDTALEVAVA